MRYSITATFRDKKDSFITLQCGEQTPYMPEDWLDMYIKCIKAMPNYQFHTVTEHPQIQ